ncbi:MAG: ester cyclase [Chloroflexota bacterium]
MKTNREIIEEVISEVVNQKQLERYPQFVSEEYFSRGDAFIGLGFSAQPESDTLRLQFIAPGSPAEGVLEVGDELLWAAAGEQRWSTAEEISQGFIGSFRGEAYRVGVRRGEQSLEFELSRGLVPGYDTPREQARANLEEFITEEFPDLRAEIRQIVADGEMVVALLEYRGTHAGQGCEAIWQEAWFVRFADGKIIEDWTVFNGSNYFRQLGYRMVPPGS